MARKFSKDEIRDKIDGNELDLSMSQLTKVPVRELVSFLVFNFSLPSAEHQFTFFISIIAKFNEILLFHVDFSLP